MKKDKRSLEEKIREDYQPGEKILLRTGMKENLFIIETAEIIADKVVAMNISNSDVEILMRC